ncbi:MAG: hypothetical protein V4487_07910 [Chlamydiota bacterium]
MIFSHFATAESSEFLDDSNIEQDLICQQIKEEQPGSILFCEGGKMYLRPEHIYATSEGLFLKSGSLVLPISRVLGDTFGCYLPYNSTDDLNRPTGYWSCFNPHCENYLKVWHGKSSKCPKCQRKASPSCTVGDVKN